MRKRYELVTLDDVASGARDFELRPGHAFAKAVAGILAISVALGAAVAAVGAPAVIAATSSTTQLTDYWAALPSDLPIAAALPQHVILLDRDGVEFARFYSENRIPVTFEQISPNFTNALVATEDSRFYDHNGVDLPGIARAAITNMASNERTEGGSTITQQLVQNILITNARNDAEKSVAVGDTYEAKLREAKYAISLEKSMSKQEILATYSNAVYFGNLAYGVQAASQVYFNTDAASLTIPQAAMLVALLKSPVAFDPYAYPDVAQPRRDIVIDRMLTEGYLTAEEAAAATAEPIVLTRGETPSGCAASPYPYYCALVHEEILTSPAFGETLEARKETLRRGGLTLTTALNRGVADASLNATVAALNYENRVASGTATIVPGTGHIAAVAENRTWGQTQVVYAASKFQPGSVMKPLTLVTALEQGMPLSTSFNANGPYISRIVDSPKKGYTNYGNSNPGTIDARTAIRQSVNIYFVKLIEKTTVPAVVEMGERLGLTTLGEVGARTGSFALGTSDVQPLEMANVYATFASGGIKCNPIAVTSGVITTTGEPIATPPADCHQEISPAVAAQMTEVLQGTFRGGTLSGVGALPGRETGGKTGTTDDSAANWTVGMTAQYSTAVWVGDPRGGQAYPLTRVLAYGRTLYKTTGSAIAGRIWKTIMTDIHVGVPAAPFPGG